MVSYSTLMQAGQPWEMDPHTLETYPGPETLGDFLSGSSTPTNPLAKVWDQAFGRDKAEGQEQAAGKGNLALGKGKTMLKGQAEQGQAMGRGRAAGQGKAAGLGKACTAHPHVVHGAGTSDRLAIFSSQT